MRIPPIATRTTSRFAGSPPPRHVRSTNRWTNRIIASGAENTVGAVIANVGGNDYAAVRIAADAATLAGTPRNRLRGREGDERRCVQLTSRAGTAGGDGAGLSAFLARTGHEGTWRGNARGDVREVDRIELRPQDVGLEQERVAHRLAQLR